jgi:rhamnogalacturonan endolyase
MTEMKYRILLCLLAILVYGCGPTEQKNIEVEGIIMEKLDRGVVALQIDEGNAYVGWRLLKEDPADVAFNVYRRQVGSSEFEKVNDQPITTSTNFVDSSIKLGQAYRYRIHKIVNSVEEETPGEGYVFIAGKGERETAAATEHLLNRPYYSIKLNDDVTINRVGIGDLNNDGAYDFIIQHPQFNTDPYFRIGYWRRSMEPYKLDAYSSKGKFLWRYDMGWAIESGTWYAPYLVYDIDGDGYAEVYAKAGEGDPRELDGRVLEGPEYLVKIDGRTGEIMQKADWLSKEGYEHYNFWSRNFLATGYFDGKKPSLVMKRGTYTTIKLEALCKNLEREWYFESSGDYAKYRGQGGHAILVADVDLDGKDDIIPGTFALNNKGEPIWHTGLGHNDVGVVTNFDASRPGMQVFYGIESRSPKHGVCMVDAATGEVIWGYEGKTTHVHGGMVGDICPENPGIECYAGEAKGGDGYFLYSADGKLMSDQSLGALSPRVAWWDADEQKELIIGGKVFKYKGDTLLGIEGRIVMIADIIGDWREEIVTALPGEIRIYSTNIPANTRKVCLMQNRQYRLGVANSTTAGYFTLPQLGLEPKNQD